ncbi:MAG: site-specific integrase [Deltaproteobacteria bacterium]|nr:site-specific integrase [Deltaproteobacteria bacterium]
MGEIQALRWMDIEFERKILHVRRTYVRLEQCFKDFPKGRKQHSHRIPDELLSLLLEASKNQRTENLVASTKEGRVLDYGYFRKALKRYCKEAGVKIVAAHGLRHSTSELYMAHGATRDDLRLLYGHSDHRTTDRYIHDNGDRLSAVAKVIRLRP